MTEGVSGCGEPHPYEKTNHLAPSSDCASCNVHCALQKIHIPSPKNFLCLSIAYVTLCPSDTKWVILMLTREQLRQTEQWQALNNIWKQLSPQQKQAITPEFQLLSAFIQQTVEPPKDYSVEDAGYKEHLSNDAAAFAAQREQAGQNLYDGMMKLLSRSTFESPEKFMIFFDLKYQKKYPWVTENRDELLEILDLVWNRIVERGFVPGEGFPK